MITDAPAESASVPGRFRTRGHPRAVESVRAMIAGRLPHAILVGGPAGIGKTTLALDLAAGLLCDDPEPSARPCRACRGCRLVEKGIHPDLHRLAPAGPGDQIRIGSRSQPEEGTIRRLTTDLALLPVEGGARVAIIERADRMGDDAQTALLKTLEEPPAGVAIVLCADDEDRLMPTVRSRCARIRLGPVGTREIEALLGEGDIADPPMAARLARLSGGRPGLARSLARAPDAVALRDEVARTLLDLIARGPADRLVAARELAARAAELDRLLRAAMATDASDAAAGPPTTQLGRSRRGARATAPGAGRSSAAAAAGEPAIVDHAAASGDTGDENSPDEADSTDVGSRIAAPAAERRRAASAVIGLWRDVARDLLVVRLGAERDLRDPALLDDLRVANAVLGTAHAEAGSDRPATATSSDITGRDPVARALAEFLGRLDTAGELLESNVRAELVLDTLVLAWPSTATTEPPTSAARSRSGR